MARKRFLFIDQEVDYGTQTIKIGFRRDILKVINKLRVRTCDTVILEDVISLPYMSTLSLSGIKHLVIRNVGLLPHASIYGMDDLETLEISGSIGYLDSGFIGECKNLKSISIHANVFSSNEYIIVSGCYNLSSINIKGVLPTQLIHVTDEYRTYFENFKVEGKSKFPFDNFAKTWRDKSVDKIDEIRDSLINTSKWVNKVYGHNKYLDDAIGEGASYMWGVISNVFNSWTRAYKLRRIGWDYGREHSNPTVKTLKLSGPYRQDEKRIEVSFEYAPAFRPAFETYRRKFHLWKVSGKGADTDKMIRLCRWVHEKIRHKGDAVPKTGLNLASLMIATSYSCKPGNCFVQAICLSEALLSIGIKAKYIKGFRRKSDEGCYHVFVAAWSSKLKKWIFLDPTYGAYVMDTYGNILSPAEIRHNLINDIPMVLNEDADYNGDKEATKTYLSNFLPQYMYYMMANTISQDSTEGPSRHVQGKWITLAPVEEIGDRYFSGEKTTDEAIFWQAPD